jgi:hypothetical protein
VAWLGDDEDVAPFQLPSPDLATGHRRQLRKENRPSPPAGTSTTRAAAFGGWIERVCGYRCARAMAWVGSAKTLRVLNGAATGHTRPEIIWVGVADGREDGGLARPSRRRCGVQDEVMNMTQLEKFLKVDKGPAEEQHGVQLMKPIDTLDDLLELANRHRIFGTRMTIPDAVRPVRDARRRPASPAGAGPVRWLQPRQGVRAACQGFEYDCQFLLRLARGTFGSADRRTVQHASGRPTASINAPAGR